MGWSKALGKVTKGFSVDAVTICPRPTDVCMIRFFDDVSLELYRQVLLKVVSIVLIISIKKSRDGTDDTWMSNPWDCSFMDHNILGTYQSEEISFKRPIVQELTFGDTSVGDELKLNRAILTCLLSTSKMPCISLLD